MSPTALLILAEGAEEMEAVISADVLRRGGLQVTIAGLAGPEPVKCSREVVIVPDVSLADASKDSFDVIVLPGGLKGAESIAQSLMHITIGAFVECHGMLKWAEIGEDATVKKMLQEQEKKGKYIAAICAAPFALKTHGIGIGKSLTSHPCKQAELSEGQYTYLEDRVVVDGQLITSRGPGTAFEFALTIVEKLVGKEKADSLVGPMLVKK